MLADRLPSVWGGGMHKARSASKFVTAPACLLTGWLRRPAQQRRWWLGHRHSSAAGWSPPTIACKGNDLRKLLAGTFGSWATGRMSARLLHPLDTVVPAASCYLCCHAQPTTTTTWSFRCCWMDLAQQLHSHCNRLLRTWR